MVDDVVQKEEKVLRRLGLLLLQILGSIRAVLLCRRGAVAAGLEGMRRSCFVCPCFGVFCSQFLLFSTAELFWDPCWTF